MNEEELQRDILFQIDMQLYDKYNKTIAGMNDHLGDIYTYRDIEEVEQAQKDEKIDLLTKAIKELQKEIEEKEKVIDEMAKKLVDVPIPNSQEENILFFNSLDVKKFFYKKDEIKGKIEELASNEHSRWANWQKYVHSICIKNEDGSLTIPKEYVEHWEYEINTEYKDLPEKIKESDRKEVRQILELLGE